LWRREFSCFFVFVFFCFFVFFFLAYNKKNWFFFFPQFKFCILA
jgi:hypothetical protein